MHTPQGFGFDQGILIWGGGGGGGLTPLTVYLFILDKLNFECTHNVEKLSTCHEIFNQEIITHNNF